MANVYNQEVEHWARQQRDHFHDRVNVNQDPRARMIYQEIERIENMAQSGHTLRSIHDQMQGVQRQLLQAQHSNQPLMPADHSVELYHNFETMRNNLRRNTHF